MSKPLDQKSIGTTQEDRIAKAMAQVVVWWLFTGVALWLIHSGAKRESVAA